MAVAQPPLSILIRGGLVYDGLGGAGREMAVGLRGDRIVYLGDATQAPRAERVLNAQGWIVAPGFIDPHAHVLEDLSRPARAKNENYLLQGVTTVISGNDGAGPFKVQEALDKWTQNGIGTNAAMLVGFGSVRREILGMSAREPSAEQLDQMKALVRRAMSEGAIGFSAGLFYTPQKYAKTGEVIALAKEAAGGYYDTHIRDESSYDIGLLGSVEEAIRIAREAKIRVNLSHIKALGVDVWGQSKQAIALVEQARREGLRITADQYPYSASGSGLNPSLLPGWAEEGGKLKERLADPQLRPKIEKEMEENMRRRGGPASFLLLSPRDQTLKGKRLTEIATMWSASPIQAAIRIIEDGGAGVASFNMSEEDIENFMRQDWVMTCSDGSYGHPRKYGTFPRKIKRYVLDRKVISMAQAIRSSTSFPADALGLKDRGRLAVGALADVIVFDPATIADQATYEEPERLSTGMQYVIVNGQIAVEGGKYNGVRAGRALKRTP
jgi:N-acyl-D-aspartate/D-glutamate deacylase